MAKNQNISEFIPELLPIEKSIHQQITDVKTTIIKMFVNRGFIKEENKENYLFKFIFYPFCVNVIEIINS